MFNSQLQNSVVHRMSALLEEDMDHLQALRDAYDNSRQGLAISFIAAKTGSAIVYKTHHLLQYHIYYQRLDCECVCMCVCVAEHEHAMAKFSRTSKRRDSDKVQL